MLLGFNAFTCDSSSRKMLSTTLHTKTIQHLTLKQRNDTSRLIELSTYHQIKLFFTHDLQKNGGIDIQQIRSSNNLADFFKKSFLLQILKSLYRISEFVGSKISTKCIVLFFLSHIFFPLGF
jgi:hypothetical protein